MAKLNFRKFGVGLRLLPIVSLPVLAHSWEFFHNGTDRSVQRPLAPAQKSGSSSWHRCCELVYENSWFFAEKQQQLKHFWNQYSDHRSRKTSGHLNVLKVTKLDFKIIFSRSFKTPCCQFYPIGGRSEAANHPQQCGTWNDASNGCI